MLEVKIAVSIAHSCFLLLCKIYVRYLKLSLEDILFAWWVSSRVAFEKFVYCIKQNLFVKQQLTDVISDRLKVNNWALKFMFLYAKI